MNNFYYVSGRESIAEWWRAVGDNNLRMIGRLNIYTNPTIIVNRATEKGVMVRYRRISQKATVGLTKGAKDGQVVRVHDDDLLKGEKVRKVKRILDVIAVDGLHVRALEQMLVLLDPGWALAGAPDCTALKDPQY